MIKLGYIDLIQYKLHKTLVVSALCGVPTDVKPALKNKVTDCG